MSDERKIVSASPKVRKLAREFGADIYQIQGSQREGRVTEEDVKSFVKDSISGKVEKKKIQLHCSMNIPNLVKLKQNLSHDLKKLQVLT